MMPWLWNRMTNGIGRGHGDDFVFRFPKTLFILCAFLCAYQTLLAAEFQSSEDPNHDVIKRLIFQQKFDDAQWFADQVWKRSDRRSVRAAKAALWQAEVQLAKIRQQGWAKQKDVDSVVGPISQLLVEYPDHGWKTFLDVEALSLRHQILRDEVASTKARGQQNAPALEGLSKKLARIQQELNEIQLRFVRDERPHVLQNPKDQIGRPTEFDHDRLSGRIATLGVTLALLQTELYSPGTPDAIAAASAAEVLCQRALQKIASSSGAANEIRFLRCVAMQRSSRHADSMRALAELQRQAAVPDPRYRALAIKIALSSNDVDRAKRLAATANPKQIEGSLSLSLADLETKLAANEAADLITATIEAVRKHHGAYGARLAENLAIEKLGQSSAAGDQQVNAAVIAAAGRNEIRRGDLNRGGEMLAAAARSEVDPSKAKAFAMEAAAAWFQSKPTKAASVMMDVAETFSEEPEMADLHFQGVQLLASVSDDSALVQTYMADHCLVFPNSKHRAKLSAQLVDQFDSEGNQINAARFAMGDDAIDRWRKLFHQTESDKEPRFLEVATALQETIATGDRESSSRLQMRAAAWVSVEGLAAYQFQNVDANQLSRFRKGLETGLNLSTSSPLANDVAWRLIRDTVVDESRKAPVQRVLVGWSQELAPLERAQVQVWTGKSDLALKTLNQWLEAEGKNESNLRRAARILSSGSQAAVEQAVKHFDRIANGHPKESKGWHRAKREAIESLKRTDPEAASQRAKYILLTASNLSDNLRAWYEKQSRSR